ncbi:MAG: hydrogenase expression/formation C-terminal domain-containing protein [Gammaproteobacteria bacterium]
MTKLNEIPVKVELTGDANSMLLPVLHGMNAMLKTLIETGRGDILDLRHEPLTLEDIAELKALLGQGEIDANLTALGSTNIRETGIPGIWWITHFNDQGNVTSEFIEISTCPDMLKTFPDELGASLLRFHDKITQYTHRSTPEQVAQRLEQLGFGNEHLTNRLN